jgi:Cytochrome P460
MRTRLLGLLLVLVGVFAFVAKPIFAGEEKPAAAAVSAAYAPRFTAENQLIRPENYREWVYLSSGVDMSYGPGAADASMGPMFDNVWVHPDAYRHFLATGTWPDKTVFVLEVRHSATKLNPNKRGAFQSELVGLEAEVKDEKRFAEKWAYFGFMEDGKLKESASRFPNSACYQCHTDNGAVDHTFVQFYPTLRPIAEAKGTFDKKKAEAH